MPLDLSRHPCFNHEARKNSARIHLPVAPHCNIQCRYCKRGFDCINESRPGVSSTILSPDQALHYLEETVQRDPRITVVGIAGPGDPFANAKETMATLRGVRNRFPQMLLCVASNGLNVAEYADELAELEVSHVTLTINAVDPAIGAQIYAWVRDGKQIFRGLAAAEHLWERQQAAIKALKAHGITVKINAIIVPGINEHHIPEVARTLAEMGADLINCVPLYPVADTDFADIEQPSAELVNQVRAAAGEHLPLMTHCTRCRADAVGLLGESMSQVAADSLRASAGLPLRPKEDRPYVAVATLEGVLVNQHLGEAEELAIYEKTAEGFRWVEKRTAPAAGGGQRRWLDLAAALFDCRALLVSGAGKAPCNVLSEEGVRVIQMEGLIDEGLDAAFRGTEIRAPLRVKFRCGSGCGGNGNGCS